MILYSLKCEFGHEFDGWFRSSDDFEQQAKGKTVECPSCGSLKVEKAIMAPNVARTDERAVNRIPEAPPPADHPGMPTPKQVETYFAAMRKHVEENFDYVGESFPEEARKIHYGESEERDIYGEASPEQAQELADEGIEVAPLPGLKKKRRPRTRAN